MGAPPCNCHCSLEEVDEETANRWSNVARAASLAVRRAKAERRKKAEGGRMKDEAVSGDGNAEARETQRLRRSALLREGDSALVGVAGRDVSRGRGDAEVGRRKSGGDEGSCC